MSGAVNLFLHQCVLRADFLSISKCLAISQRTLDAMDEARRISRNS